MTITTTGEVFTRRWVVDLMLDLAGYTGDVSTLRVVEPSIGSGAFVGPMVRRLAMSGARWESMFDALRGYDLRTEHVMTCRKLAAAILTSAGCPIADELATAWFHTGDFLLSDVPTADLVIGNPPYIRVENLDPALLAIYRRKCPTMGGRADIFVGFFERGLDLLRPGGRLLFICADRWMRNGYGKRLRAKIVRDFSVDDVLVMHDADAFDDRVSAYPAIVNIHRGAQGAVCLATASEHFGGDAAHDYLAWRATSIDGYRNLDATTARMDHWHTTSGIWPDGTPEELSWLAKLDTMPKIEQAGVTLGIGIATGADTVYIQRQAAVEPDRMIPMVTPDAVRGPRFEWTGEHLVSPWAGRTLVPIDEYPLLRRFYEAYRDQLMSRNVAKRSTYWWRTIDSFNPSLMEQDLLVMQDMKLHAHPVRVPRGFYPHHGLTWFISNEWDLDALGGLLMSEPIEKQVAAHCVRMRGGTLRFQPTVLRTVHIPAPDQVPDEAFSELAAAFRLYDRKRANAAAWKLFPTL